MAKRIDARRDAELADQLWKALHDEKADGWDALLAKVRAMPDAEAPDAVPVPSLASPDVRRLLPHRLRHPHRPRWVAATVGAVGVAVVVSVVLGVLLGGPSGPGIDYGPIPTRDLSVAGGGPSLLFTDRFLEGAKDPVDRTGYPPSLSDRVVQRISLMGDPEDVRIVVLIVRDLPDRRITAVVALTRAEVLDLALQGYMIRDLYIHN